MFNDTPAQKLHWLLGVRQWYVNERLNITIKIHMVIIQCKKMCKITLSVILIKIYNKTDILLKIKCGVECK